MDVPGRSLPGPEPDERTSLSQWLDWQRATVRAKCDGLSQADAHRSLITTSPAMTMAGIVSHLTAVEHHWMVRSFLGEAARQEVDAWRPQGSLTSLLDAYDRQCSQSREIAASHSLDHPEGYAPPGLPVVTLRWILGHLVQETARHVGHLDLIRELLDGRRGY